MSGSGLIKPNWQHFLASILFALCFPLVPLAIEFLIQGHFSEPAVLLAAIMYCSALGIASNSVWIFGLGFFVSTILSISFGLTFQSDGETPLVVQSPLVGVDGAILCMVLFAIAHAAQRYDEHVVRGKDFISFRSAS